MLLAAAIGVLWLVVPTVTHAVPGDLDTTFGVGGVSTGPFQTRLPGEREQRVALDHLQRPIIAATITDASGHDLTIAVLRLTTAGVLDTTFNPTGPTPGVLTTGLSNNLCTDGTIDGPILKALAVTPDHHIMLAADLCRSNAKTRIGLVRVTENGVLDDQFSDDGLLVTTITDTPTSDYEPFVEDMAVDAMGRIYLAGGHCLAGPQSDCDYVGAFVARFTSAGVRDVTYNAVGPLEGAYEIADPPEKWRFYAMHLLADGSLVAVGAFQAVGSNDSDAFVLRLLDTGRPDPFFGPSAIPGGVVITGLGRHGPGQSLAEAHGVVVDEGDGSVFVTGKVFQATAGASVMALAKLTAAGVADSSFAVGGPATGVTYVPTGFFGTDVLLDSNGKIVVVGEGPRSPGLDPQFVLARYGSTGTLDQTFGPTSSTPGVVRTALGDYAFAWDGVLQSDGNIVVGGVRRAPINDIAAVAVRYLGGAGQAGSPTPTPTGGVPTPTATPIELPGEICGNCIDDDGDGHVDRDDAECPARADGAGQGLGTPKVEGKAIAKCSTGLEAAGAKFEQAKLQQLQQCVNAVFNCLQVKPNDAKCVGKAASGCTKHMAAIAKDRSKLTDAVAKVCGVPELGVNDLLAAAGIGYGSEVQLCADRGVTPLASLADVAACVAARHDCAVEQLLGVEVPRAAELLLAGARNPAVDTPCLPQPGPAPASGLGDPARAKVAVQCQKAIAKAGVKLVGSERKVVETCLQAVTVCVQQQPADQRCLTAARTKCGKQLAQLGAPGGVEAALAAALAKSCGTLDATELTSAVGLGYQGRAAECLALGAPNVDSAAAIAECTRRQHACRVHQVLEATTPRLHELLGIGQATLP